MGTAKASAPAVPSVKPRPAAAPNPAEAASYERSHVHAVYETIAPHFAATRYAPWPRVDAFLHGLAAGSLVCDVGCGNGKYLRVGGGSARGLFLVGGDRCAALARIARDAAPPGADVCVADALAQPFRAGVFDAVVNVAVVHHLATRARRVSAWAESVRLLRPGGRALVYVWALERPATPEPRRGSSGKAMLARRFDGPEMLVPWHMRHRKEGAASDRILGDTEEVLMRYYHIYEKGELESEVEEVEGARIVESYYDHQNWCAVIQRICL